MAIRKFSNAHHWNDFLRWCDSRKMKSLPAHPWTIASYLRWLDRHKDAQMVREAFDAISREHVLKTGRVPTRHATVKSTMEMIERRALVKDQHADLFDEDDVLDETPPPKIDFDDSEDEPDHLEKSQQRRHMLHTKPRMVRRRPKESAENSG